MRGSVLLAIGTTGVPVRLVLRCAHGDRAWYFALMEIAKILGSNYAPSWFFDTMNTNPNAAAQTVGSDRISCPANIVAGEEAKVDTAMAEIIACLIKYQARYHGKKHAQKLWDRADRALKAFAAKR